MQARNALLQDFLSSLAGAFSVDAVTPDCADIVGRIYGALKVCGGAGSAIANRLPVCRHLDDALARARAASPSMTRLADAFAALEPSLNWMPRPTGGPHASDNWPEGHANATIIGPGGLEYREDLIIGVSLLAPHVRYPDHNHSPEEAYLILSPGRFQHGESSWFELGVGDTFHNAPNIKHAMASNEAPLLAIWCLWIGQPEFGSAGVT